MTYSFHSIAECPNEAAVARIPMKDSQVDSRRSLLLKMMGAAPIGLVSQASVASAAFAPSLPVAPQLGGAPIPQNAQLAGSGWAQVRGSAPTYDAGLSRAIRLEMPTYALPGSVVVELEVQWPGLAKLALYRAQSPGTSVGGRLAPKPDTLLLEPVVVLDIAPMQTPWWLGSLRFEATGLWLALATSGKSHGWVAHEVKAIAPKRTPDWDAIERHTASGPTK